MPLDEQDAGLASGGGRFFKIRDLKPGQTLTVRLVSLTKNHQVSNPKYCIKDRDYNYRVAFVDDQGNERIMDINSPAAIGEFSRALVREGKDVPCTATLTRRTDRAQTQSEAKVERVEERGVAV